MNDTERLALEQEFEAKSAKLTEMMARMPEMEAAYAKYEAAARAGVIAALYDAFKEETEELARMEQHVEKAREALNAATKAANKDRIAAAREALQSEELACDHAKTLLQKAQARYEEEVTRQHFESEAAWQAAFLGKPAFMKLEETIQPFRQEYAQLLTRCQEIEALLDE